MKRIALALLAGLCLVTVCLTISGALYQMIGTWSDARRFPNRGHLVQAGAIRMNIDCSGQGSPTVILESGSGGPSIETTCFMNGQPQRWQNSSWIVGNLPLRLLQSAPSIRKQSPSGASGFPQGDVWRVSEIPFVRSMRSSGLGLFG